MNLLDRLLSRRYGGLPTIFGFWLLTLLAVGLATRSWVEAQGGLAEIGLRGPLVVVGLFVGSALVIIPLEIGARRRHIRPLLRVRIASVKEVDPYEIGVTPSRRADELMQPDDVRPRYIRRTQEPEILGALQRKRKLVLLVAPPNTGKSRTAFEVLDEAARDYRMIVPRVRSGGKEGGSALTELLDSNTRLPRPHLPFAQRRLVLWLDDLADFLNEG